LKIFNHFRSAFREFKQKLPNYFKGEKKPKTWAQCYKTFAAVINERL
jgi:hypothetical protein